MKLATLCLTLLLLAAALSILSVGTSQALPAFARREGVKCQMCHLRLPELNEDGHSYIRRGLREEPAMGATMGATMGGGGAMPGMAMGSGDAAKPPAASSDHALGEALPLEWQNYLTLMGHHMLSAHRHAKTDLQEGGVDLWAGGPLDTHWSALANLAIDIPSGALDVEQAYAQYNTSWTPRFQSVRVGQLLPLAILFNGGGVAMPLSAPLVLEMPSSERNPWTPTTLIRGVELGAVDLPHWNAYVGAGQPRIESADGITPHTDVYASAEVLIGKQGDAVSAFGYKGSAIAVPGQPALDFQRAMVFANAYGPREKAVLGLLWGTDSPEGEKHLGISGGFLLGEYLFTDRWAGYARYDRSRREVAGADPEVTDGPTFGVSCWAQTHVRITLETRFLKAPAGSDDRSLMAEFLWVF